MNTYAEKKQENTLPVSRYENRSVANAVSQSQDIEKSVFQFVHNRPEVATERKLHEMANNNQQAERIVQFQALANGKTSRTIQLQPGLNDVPKDVMRLIGSKLEGSDYINLTNTNRKLRQALGPDERGSRAFQNASYEKSLEIRLLNKDFPERRLGMSPVEHLQLCKRAYTRLRNGNKMRTGVKKWIGRQIARLEKSIPEDQQRYDEMQRRYIEDDSYDSDY